MASLPRLSAQQPIAVAGGKPSSLFLRFMEATRTAQEATDATQSENIAAIQQILAGLQAATQGTQAAQAAANVAQATADEAVGGGAVSGSASDPSVNLSGTAWVNGPQVDLTGVVAGNLTISGTGPVQDADVSVTGGTFYGEFRVVRIVGASEDAVFFGNMTLLSTTAPATVINTSNYDAQEFVLAEPSTGDVSYRLDARRVSGGTASNLALYIYARRAP